MAKNFNLGKTLGSPTPSFSVDNIEEMTRMIHEKKEIVPVVPVVEKVKAEIAKPVLADKAVAKKEKVTSPVLAKAIEPIQEPAKRGRKPSPPASNERMIRVSVDLPESVFIKLKTKVIMDRTDMKTFVWKLVEDTLM